MSTVGNHPQVELETFYFDTGCRPINSPKLYKDQVWRNGTKQIPFKVAAPKGSTLLFLCDNPDLPEGKVLGVIVKEAQSSMLSRYAYMRLPENLKKENTHETHA